MAKVALSIVYKTGDSEARPCCKCAGNILSIAVDLNVLNESMSHRILDTEITLRVYFRASRQLGFVLCTPLQSGSRIPGSAFPEAT